MITEYLVTLHWAWVKFRCSIFSPVDDDSGDDNELLFLSASQDQHIHMWHLTLTRNVEEDNDVIAEENADSATLLHQFKGHARSVDALAVSPNGQEVRGRLERREREREWSILFDPTVLFSILGHIPEDLVCRYTYYVNCRSMPTVQCTCMICRQLCMYDAHNPSSSLYLRFRYRQNL